MDQFPPNDLPALRRDLLFPPDLARLEPAKRTERPPASWRSTGRSASGPTADS